MNAAICMMRETCMAFLLVMAGNFVLLANVIGFKTAEDNSLW